MCRRAHEGRVNVNERDPAMTIRSTAAALAAVSLFTAFSARAADLAGYEKMSFQPHHRSESVQASLWYPASAKTYRVLLGDDAVFRGTPVYVGAAAQSGKHPLVVVSHGSGGNMNNLGWLSSALALKGAIVLSMNHPGSTSGDSSPRRSIHVQDRASDLSAALDMLLSDPTFGPLVDRTRITALGFSLGGATVLETAGARFDRKAYAAYCKRFGSAATDCSFFAKGGVDLEHIAEDTEADRKDGRFRSIIAVDPGFTRAFQEQSLTRITAPMLLVSLGEKASFPAVDLTAEGSNLPARIKGAQHAVIQGAHHFSFLALCKPAARAILADEGEDPICDDPAGSDRATVHAEIIRKVSDFLKL